MPTLPAPLPSVLSLPQTISLAEDVGTLWSIGIDGLGLLISTLDQESPFEYRSYEVRGVPTSKQRIDDKDEPGEQTLFPWWTRAQHSWHEGAGQAIFDSPLSSRFSFKASKGINIWEDGQVTLLKDTASLTSGAFEDLHLWGGVDALFYTKNGNITRDPDPDASSETNEATITTHDGVPVNSITSDGETLYLAYSGGSLGIRGVALDGAFSSTSLINDHTAVDLIAFVKGRLVGAKDHQIFDYDLTGTSAPTAHDSDASLEYRYTGITDAGPGIYFSGFVGERSDIRIARLAAQDLAAGLTLGALRTVWTAPKGEIIHSIKGYLGQSLVIGTSRGVRIAVISTEEGDVQVSSLLVETTAPVKALETNGDFAWFTWSQYDSVSSGLGRIHLGDLSYASDIMATSQGEVYSVAEYNDRMYFTELTTGTSTIYKEHATNLVASANLQTGEIRFGTSETKSLRYFDLVAKGSGKWSLELASNGNDFVAYTTDNVIGTSEEVVNLDSSRFDINLILNRDSGDATLGPTLLEWRLRAEPKSSGRFRYIIPVMIYDYTTTLNKKVVGNNGRAWFQLNHLMDIYREDRLIYYQLPETGVPGVVNATKQVKMEDFQFKVYTPPEGFKGFGGIGLVILRDAR